MLVWVINEILVESKIFHVWIKHLTNMILMNKKRILMDHLRSLKIRSFLLHKSHKLKSK